MRDIGFTLPYIHDIIEDFIVIGHETLIETVLKWARINVDLYIVFDKHSYSVCDRFIGREIDLRAMARAVEVFLNGERIASHVCDDTSYHHSTLPEHGPENLQSYLSWNPE